MIRAAIEKLEEIIKQNQEVQILEIDDRKFVVRNEHLNSNNITVIG